MYASCLWGFWEAFCSVPLTWVNEGNELGKLKRITVWAALPDSRRFFSCGLFPGGDNICLPWKWEKTLLWQKVSMAPLHPRLWNSAPLVSARSPGTRCKQPPPPEATFSRWKGKGTDLFPSHLPSRMQRVIIVPEETFLLRWIFCLGFEVRSLGTWAPVIWSWESLHLHFEYF